MFPFDPDRHRASRAPAILLGVAGILAVALFLGPSGPIWCASTEDHLEAPEPDSPAAMLLKTVSTAPEKTLSTTPGLSPQVVAKIMAHRAAGGSFKTIDEFRKVTGISAQEFHAALKPYREQTEAKTVESQRKPVPDPPDAPSKAAAPVDRRGKAPSAKPASPAGRPASSAETEGPIGDVRPFYAILPGYDDLDKIDPALRKQFLELVNREMCACGCSGETVAFCLVNDPGCPVVKARVRKIYEEIVGKPQSK
jgi:hypothetical protein